jgi:hypothetical protein
MRVERITVQACCGKTAILFKIDRPIIADLIKTFVDKGFTESPNFTKAGLLYVDNLDLIVTGSLGTDRLHITCKHRNVKCDQKLNELEGLLLQME